MWYLIMRRKSNIKKSDVLLYRKYIIRPAGLNFLHRSNQVVLRVMKKFTLKHMSKYIGAINFFLTVISGGGWPAMV